MRIIINLTIIQSGGGLQVALSFLEELKNISNHEYYCLVSKNLHGRLEGEFPNNFKFSLIHPSPSSLLHGRKSVKKNSEIEKEFVPDVVFTLFGPSYWKPKAPHLCGYALPHYIYSESPFFDLIPLKQKIKWKLMGLFKFFSLEKHADYYVTETEDASTRLAKKLKIERGKVFTVNNAYHGIYNTPDKWLNVSKKVTNASGFKLITISAFYPHKNLAIIPQVIDYINANYPDFEFTFILTFDESKFPKLSEDQKRHLLFLGKVNIEECPPLYQQADALFMPTLLECFTVSYLEAMKMKIPILTSDLPFAYDICQDAALYFEPLNPKSVGESIFKLAKDENLRHTLIKNGSNQLKRFGTATDRAKSYISILEKINKHENKK